MIPCRYKTHGSLSTSHWRQKKEEKDFGPKQLEFSVSCDRGQWRQMWEDLFHFFLLISTSTACRFYLLNSVYLRPSHFSIALPLPSFSLKPTSAQAKCVQRLSTVTPSSWLLPYICHKTAGVPFNEAWSRHDTIPSLLSFPRLEDLLAGHIPVVPATSEA